MSIGADAKVLIDGAGTALTAVYRGSSVPDNAPFPYASFLDPISDAPALSGDGKTLARRRLLQVDVWQTEEAEVVGLVESVVDAIDGETQNGHRFKVIDSVLVPSPEGEDDLVHHAITVSTTRNR